MADYRDDRDFGERRSELADIVDGAVRRVSTAIAIAGALIAIGIYARPGPPRYQAVATETGVVRVNTRSGSLVECVDGQCGIILLENRHLSRRPPPRPAAAPAQSVAAPAPQPAAALPAPKQTAPQQPAPQPAPAR